MGFWSRAETELLISIAAGDPRTATVITNWPYYLTRVERCQGFTKLDEFAPESGGREITGAIDIGSYNYLWLRRKLFSDALVRFEAEKAKLEAPERTLSAYQVGAGERETVFHAVADDPYWLTVDTDAAIWLKRLSEHPFAVLLSEQAPENGTVADSWTHCRYALPRQLLTIRRNKVTREISEAERQMLRERLARIRKAA